MKEIKINKANEVIYKETLDNGLQIYIFRRKCATSFTERLVFNVGGRDINFIDCNGKEVNVPLGTHHYLEHVLCECEDLSSTLSYYSSFGAYSNAYTSLTNTAFVFDGTSNFKDMALFQLNSIFNKKFNDEMVEHERGPISEEASSSLSNNYRVASFKYHEYIFDNKIYGESLTGNLDDIKNITRNDLELVYNNFYKPDNAYVIVTTSEEPESIINIYKEFFKDNKYDKLQAKKLEYNHKKTFRNSIEEVNFGFDEPIANVCLKLGIDKSKERDKLKSARLLLTCEFGEVSSFKNELLYKDKISNELNFDLFIRDNVLVIDFYAKTYNPEEFSKRIIDKLNNLDLNINDINRKIKCAEADYLDCFDHPKAVSNVINTNINTYGDLDTLKDYISFNIDYIKEIKKEIDDANKGVFIVR